MKENKAKKFSEALGEIDDRYINESLDYEVKTSPAKNSETAAKLRRKRGMKRLTALAACLCVLLGGIFAISRSGHFMMGSQRPASESSSSSSVITAEGDGGAGGDMSEPAPGLPEDSTGVSQNSDTLGNKNFGMASDMLACLVYNGNVYYQYSLEEYDDLSIVGDKIGTINGTIDEWTPKDQYEEGTGTMSGDFYELNVYSPSEMVCMVNETEDGKYLIWFFANSNEKE